MTEQEMRRAIVAANKRRQRLIRAGFKGFANVNTIQDIIDNANRISPFATKKKRTTLNANVTGAALKRQFLAAKQILNLDQSSLRVANKERKTLESELSRRISLSDRYGFDFEHMTERRIRALYNLLNDGNVKKLMDIYNSDEVVDTIVESFNRGDSVKSIRVKVRNLLANISNVDGAVVEDLYAAFDDSET